MHLTVKLVATPLRRQRAASGFQRGLSRLGRGRCPLGNVAVNLLASRLGLILLGGGLAALLAGQPGDAQSVPSAAIPAPAGSRAAGEGAPAQASPVSGYLPPGEALDVASLIGPSPTQGSGTQAGDIATFRATRALQGGARWALATRDAVYGPEAMLQDFSCAVGVQLTPANSPVLDRMLTRVGVDAAGAASRSKKVFKRPRPFVDNEGPICVAKDPSLVRSYSYPSGHSTYSWTVGLVLADAAPDRITQILGRARAYGESRVVCGVHYESDVQAGRIAASAVFLALQAQPEFERDLAMARSQLAALRNTGGPAPDAQQCRVEDEAAAHSVW